MILVVVEGGGDGFQVVVVGCEVGGCCGCFFFSFVFFCYGFDFGMVGYLVLIVVVSFISGGGGWWCNFFFLGVILVVTNWGLWLSFGGKWLWVFWRGREGRSMKKRREKHTFFILFDREVYIIFIIFK